MLVAPDSISGEWPFVGREVELAFVGSLIEERSSGGVVIAAPAGVGKTRMAAECAAMAAAAGFEVARTTATAAAAIPLAALSNLLPKDQGTVFAQDLADLLGRARTALLARGGGRQLALIVDDAHLLDDTTATLIYQMIAAREVFVVMTARVAEPAPELLVTAWKDGLIERLELSGLTDDAVAELLGRVLGQVDPDSARVLAGTSQQNVLFLRELVVGAVNDETLCQHDGVWRLRKPLTPSARLIELIETRLHGLDERERAVVEVMAVGEPLALDELADVADPDVAEGLERKGIVICQVEGPRVELRLAHPVYGEAVRARLPVLRMRSIARSLADRIERSGPPNRVDLLRVGRLRLLSGDGGAETLLAAARAARWSYAFSFAELLVGAAIESEPSFDAELLAAGLAGLQGRWSDAEQRLCGLWERARDDAERAQVAIARMDNFLYAGRDDDHLTVARDAEAAIDDQLWRDEIQARTSPVLVMSKGPRATWDAVSGLISRTSGGAFVWASLTGAHALCRLGSAGQALELTERGFVAQLELTEPIQWYPWFHLFNRCEVLLRIGRIHEAESLAREQHERAVADHSPEAQASFASQLAMVLTARGRVETASRFAREAFVVFDELGRPMFARQSLHRLATALALAGRPADARDALDMIGPMSQTAPMYDAVELGTARGWVLAADGHIQAARAGLLEVATLAERIGDRVGLASALHGIARLGGATDVVDRLAEAIDGADGSVYPALLLHVRGLALGDPALLDDSAFAFERMGADLLAAEASADAAVRWMTGSEQRRAAAAVQRARRFALQCEGAMTPALRSIESRARLTAAEREAVELAARGRSNKAIAAELVLSVRSVENRLQRAYEKLGITGRDQLARALEFYR